MISEKLKSIYIHIPKTAGSSIERALLQSEGDFRYFHPSDFEIERLPPHVGGYKGINRWDIKHFPPRYLKAAYRDYHKFCFVRNPWDLVVSCYFWWTQQAKLEFRQLQGRILSKMGFSNFALSCYTDYINEIFHCGLGQSYWLLDESNRYEIVHHIGRFEQLQQDFDKICDIVGLEQIRLPYVNKSNHLPYATYYNNMTARLISYKFARDISRFGYTLHVPEVKPEQE